MKQLIIKKQTPSRKAFLFLMSIFQLWPGSKMSIKQHSFRKNLFVGACFCWDSRFFRREIDQNLIWWNHWLWELVLGTLFRHFKVFRLHAMLHDAAGAVRAHSGKEPDYCYKIGQPPNSYFLGHVTGLLFCLYVKVFLPSTLQLCRFLKQYVLHCTRY